MRGDAAPLTLILEGAMRVTQERNETRLSPGDFAMWTSSPRQDWRRLRRSLTAMAREVGGAAPRGSCPGDIDRSSAMSTPSWPAMRRRSPDLRFSRVRGPVPGGPSSSRGS